MRYSEINDKTKLFEMPYLMVGDIDWRLNDDDTNLVRSEMITSLPREVVLENEIGVLYRRRFGSEGEFAFIEKDTRLIKYYMKYKESEIPELGRCATQVKIWMMVSRGTKNMTSMVFFDIMLKEYNTMVSDRDQTEDGRRFWTRRLAEAADAGMSVGLIGLDNQIDNYDRSANFNKWLERVDGWGTDKAYREKRFFITNGLSTESDD